MTWQPRVGAATAEVLVPVGTPLAGFAARTTPATGTHDPMTVRALVVDRTALVSIDCCVLHEDTCAEIRARALAAAPLDEVVVAATHTHAGPCIGLDRVGGDVPSVRRAAMAAAVGALSRAAAAAVACTTGHAEVRGLGIARNRRHLESVIDPPLHVVAFDDADGHRVATMLSYPCHPVVLDGSNTLVSADYIGPLRDRVEARHGGICVFLTGAAGDVNTGHSAEASYTVAGAGQRTFAEAARVGGLLADAAIAADLAPVTGAGPASVRSAGVHLALDPLDRDLVARQAAEWRHEVAHDSPRAALLQAWLAWAENLPADPATSWAGRTCTVSWGSLSLVTLPGEPFLAAAETLSARHDGPVLVLGYCDGVPGYLPSAHEYPLGGYEVVDAHRYYGMPAGFSRGSLEALVDVAAGLLDP